MADVYCLIQRTAPLEKVTDKMELTAPLAYDNTLAHCVQYIAVDKAGNAVDLDGCTVTASFLKSNGATVSPITGTVTGDDNNIAQVVLPASCYATPGRFKLTVNLTKTGGYTRTVLWLEGRVEQNTTETIVDPGTPVTNYSTIISNATTAASAATSAAEAANTAAASINYRSALRQNDATTIADNTDYDTLTTPGNYKCTSSNHAATMTHVPTPNAAHRLFVFTTTASANLVQMALINYASGTYILYRSKFTNSTGWSNWTRLAERTWVSEQITAALGTIPTDVDALEANIPNRLSFKYSDANTIADSTDYDSLTTPGNYKCTTSYHAATMSHAPSGNAHRLSVYSTTDNNNFLQIAYVNYSKGTLLKFRSKTNTTGWTDWKTLADRDWVSNKIATDEIPDYYFDDDYLPDRIDTIIGNNASIGLNSDSFIFFTDPHTWRDGDVTATQNGMQQVKLIRYIIDHTNIDHVVCGGDMTNGDYMTQTQELELLKATRAFFDPIWDKMHMVIGNHEWNTPGSDSPEANRLTMNQIYPMLLKDKEKDYGSFDETSGSYWVDNTFQKIRYFFLGCNYGGNIDRAEAAWFATQLGQVPSGYTVFVISHIGLNVADGDTVYMGRFSDIAGLLDAAKAKTTFTGAQYSNPITADYTNLNITVAGVISGHKHRDLEMYTTGGIPIIGVTCDKGVVSNSTNLFKAARTLGTIGEQAIDVVQIDITNRKIYVTRIGGCLTGASYDSETGKVYDTEAGTGTEYDATKWTIYSPYKDREYTF